jgi:uncharacterized membrane protein YphA (DoxX/SURF4 family)
MDLALWIVQGVLAALFVFAGGMKLVTPVEEMLKQMPMAIPGAGAFLRFIGVAELLGGLGLVLPGLLRIRPGLTPLAALGLVIVMAGATGLGLWMGDPVATLIPFAVGVLAAFVAYGRWRRAPHRASSPPASLRPAR